ncbi:aminotransferase class I/II-fold pyridoxal phosphate-dependent enzyme [Bradyrhizobium sp. STM 3562]|uniref:aminotransferase class I/II-fold pyridoxal phosphate-dependent enzyme n=1 Tax=Bradyrhizobium sp. STM 3562 TaxID=578924 RepID=UPI00389034A8
MQQQIAPPDGGLATGGAAEPTYLKIDSAPYFDPAMAGLTAVGDRFRTGRPTNSGNYALGSRTQVIDFVRCSYLGLDNHPVIIAGATEAIEAKRPLDWSSAATPLRFALLTELEEILSEIFNARVLAFSSAMLANFCAMPVLASGLLTGGKKPLLVFDHSAHVSLAYHKPVAANETRVKTIAHKDMDALERLCRENPVVAYVCDGIYSRGSHSPIEELRELQERYGLFLYIDDAHGLSIFGPQGEGFARSQLPQELGDRTIITASLAKGFGASGGVLMLGAADHEALFRRHSIPQAFSAAPNLAAVGAALGSCKIHRSAELGQRQRRLAQRIDLFDRRVATAGQGNSLPIRVIAIGSETNAIAIAKRLFDSGFYTLVTFLPDLDQCRAGIRVCITAEHDVRDIERLCDAILENVAEITGKPYPIR